MTFEELREKCSALTIAGDAAADATLRLYYEWVLQKHAIENAEGEIEDLRAEVAKLQNRLSNVMSGRVMSAIEQVIADQARLNAGMFEGVKFNGQKADDHLDRPLANLPQPRPLSDSPIRENTSAPTTADQIKRIQAVAKEYGIDVGSPEAAAIAHTRQVNGLPMTTDPAVVRPPNVAAAAGSYDKSSKMDTHGAGNKD